MLAFPPPVASRCVPGRRTAQVLPVVRRHGLIEELDRHEDPHGLGACAKKGLAPSLRGACPLFCTGSYQGPTVGRASTVNTQRGAPFRNKLRGQTPSLGLIQSISPGPKISALIRLWLLGGYVVWPKKTRDFSEGRSRPTRRRNGSKTRPILGSCPPFLGDEASLPGVMDDGFLSVQAEFA
jgi:hypothetical protein